MLAVRAWRRLWAVANFSPKRFWPATLQVLVWSGTIFLIVLVTVLVRAGIDLQARRFKFEIAQGNTERAATLVLPLLPLFWIAASKKLSWPTSLMGLVLFLVVAFADRRLGDMVVPLRMLPTIAGMYLFLWAGNRFTGWREFRKARRVGT